MIGLCIHFRSVRCCSLSKPYKPRLDYSYLRLSSADNVVKNFCCRLESFAWILDSSEVEAECGRSSTTCVNGAATKADMHEGSEWLQLQSLTRAAKLNTSYSSSRQCRSKGLISKTTVSSSYLLARPGQQRRQLDVTESPVDHIMKVIG